MAVLHWSADVTRTPELVAATEAGVGEFTFLPHHRTGAAGACRTPFATTAPSRARIEVAVLLSDGVRTEPTGTTVTLRGPGDVLGLDQRQVVRRFPEPGAADAEPSDLAHCELDLPDLPWMFTPTAPDADGHLPPWLRLVVVPRDLAGLRAPVRPGLPPSVEIPVAELPPPRDAWAWAHVQVIGPPSGADVAELDARLGPASPQLNVARLLCPRRLDRRRSWRALLVPTFEAGRLAGLGRDPVGDLRWAWGGDGSPALLPVYDHWDFSTGDDGDFETLAERLTPVAAPSGVGRRLVDTGHPGLGLQPGPGGPRPVRGPLVRPDDGPGPTTGSWDEATSARLRELIEEPDRTAFDPAAPADPVVAPPVYAGVHLATGTVPEAGSEPAWLGELNLDPEHRIAAALGAAVARMDQEELMTSAWAQLPAVRDANAALRAGQLARFVGERLDKRHLARLSGAHLLAVTQRAHARIRTAPGVTARAVVAGSATAPAALGPGLRRLARPAGPLHRFAPRGGAIAAYESLLTDGGQGVDWVRTYTEPDGVHRLGEGTRALLERLGLSRLLGHSASLAEPTVLDELTLAGSGAHLGHGLRGATEEAARAAMTALLDALPTLEELRNPAEPESPEARRTVAVAVSVVPQALSVARTEDVWVLDSAVLERHGLTSLEPSEDLRHVRVSGSVIVEAVLFRLWNHLRSLGEVDGHPPEEASGSLLRQLLDRLAHEAAELEEDLGAVYDDLFVDTADHREPPRPPLLVDALGLSTRLDPVITVPRRLRQRVPGLDAHFPGWLDNDRLDPVMAAPTFAHPMYEALNRYDQEWLLPGVGRIQPHEMVTLLETNPAFVEAFLVGLNHEFARELVWREYPTDWRATSFRSFWTPGTELTDRLHRLTTGALGTHLSAAGSGRLVFLVRGELVRRYPQLLAHVVRQADGPPIVYDDPPARTLFQLPVAPDVLLVGVDLVDSTVRAADPVAADRTLPATPPDGSWWLTLSEHVGEPRFGLDEVASPGAERDDLAWADWVSATPFLDPAGAPRPVDWPDLPGSPGTPQPLSAATVGWLLFQLPARAGFRAARLLLGLEEHHG